MGAAATLPELSEWTLCFKGNQLCETELKETGQCMYLGCDY